MAVLLKLFIAIQSLSYRKDDDFLHALKAMIDRLDYWRTQSLRTHIEKYDWFILRPKYDQIFAELTSSI